MKEFIFSEESAWDGPRGLVHFVPGGELPKGMITPQALLGREVTVGGKTFVVRGVEYFPIAVSEGHPYNLGFGLLE